MQSNRSSGFTLVELLVVIAIIGMLVALLLPAVQAARESGRRTTCFNNLHELGMGIYLYEQTKKELPHANNQHSWVTYTLPFIEQENLHKKYDFNVRWSHNRNRPVVTTVLQVMACPSAPPVYARVDSIGAPAADYAPLGNVANALVRSGLIKRPHEQAGMMKKNGFSTWAHVLDGQSNTLMLAEDAGRPEHWITGTVRGPNNNTPGGGNNAVRNGRVLGAAWADNRSTIPLHGFTWNGLRAPGPCAINCTNNNETYSFHPTGASVCFGDRRVLLLNEKIDIAVYAAMITQNGRDPYTMP